MSDKTSGSGMGPASYDLDDYQRGLFAGQKRVKAEYDAAVWATLQKKYALADSFRDTALRIWWDGKED